MSGGEGVRDLILESMTDLAEVKQRCLDNAEECETARELLIGWMDWYGSNRKNSMAPSVATARWLER